MLKHYDLRYNVAIVDIICFRSPRAIELEKDIHFAPNTDVVAVGFLLQKLQVNGHKGGVGWQTKQTGLQRAWDLHM